MIRTILQERLAHKFKHMISHPEGWDDIVRQLHDELIAIVPEYKVVQTKEKFGGLRFYIQFPKNTDRKAWLQAHQLLRDAEEKSYRICDKCGQPGQIRHNGWIRTLCDRCQALREGQDVVTWEDEGGLSID